MYSFRRPAHGAVMLSKTAKLKSVKKKSIEQVASL